MYFSSAPLLEIATHLNGFIVCIYLRTCTGPVKVSVPDKLNGVPFEHYKKKMTLRRADVTYYKIAAVGFMSSCCFSFNV